MTILRIPTPLRPYADGHSQIELHAAPTVGAALRQLVERYPALEKHLFNEGGGLRPFVNLYRNEEDIRHLQGLDTPLSDADRLLLIPSIAGGRA